jgi:hypothetical protein
MRLCCLRARPARAGAWWMFFALHMLFSSACAPDAADDDGLDQTAFAQIVETTASPSAKPTLNLDVRRSLVVTEQPILARFTFQRVLDQLVAQSGVPGLTSLALFQQWWDTNNPAAQGLGRGANCDTAAINSFPFTCRPSPAEGKQAQCTSLSDPDCAYVPIGLFNRFDLAPVDGAHCGEHRIVFAKASGVTDSRNRNLIIFEAALPNPLPNQGIKGCRKIVDEWANLNAIDDLNARADKLEAFYFAGHGNIPPVISVEHYGDNALGVGQIRSDQFMSPTGSGIPWSLREFKLLRSGCPGTACAMRMLPVTVKNNPYGPLFGESPGSDANGADNFAAYFAKNSVASLAAATRADIGMITPEKYDAAQSNSSGTNNDSNYPGMFAENADLPGAIQTTLTAIGSTLTPLQIVARAQTQSCAGCHQLSNNADLGGSVTWPASLNFVHISERLTEVVDGVTRYQISPALIQAFLPVRKEVMEQYLLDQPGRYRGTGRTIGGSETD